MWFEIARSELDYVSGREPGFHNEALLPCSPERAFDIFAGGEGQEIWFKDFVSVHWDQPPPHGTGSTRVVVLKTLSVKERFLAWERGQRLSFSIDACTVPLVKAMAEDIHFEPAAGGCKVVWNVYFTPTWLERMLSPISRPLFNHMFKTSLEGLVRYAGAHPTGR